MVFRWFCWYSVGLICFFVLSSFGIARAEGQFTPGFQTLGIWEQERNLRLDVALWYPSRKATSDVQYDEWTFSVARGATPVPGKRPLVILSHDTSGSRFTLHFLADALARCGFVVAALTHTGDNVDNMAHLFSLNQLVGRVRELKALLDVLLETKNTAEMIDVTRVSVVGVGPGATAALLLAGGRLDATGWGGYCRRAGASDPYCSSWLHERMAHMATAISEAEFDARQLADPRIRTAVLVAPAYGMFFSRESLAGVRTPVLLLRADLDQVNRGPHHAVRIRDALPIPPQFSVLEHTDKPSLMAPCSPSLTQMLPDLCTPSVAARSENSRQQLNDRVSRFLLDQLGAVEK